MANGTIRSMDKTSTEFSYSIRGGKGLYFNVYENSPKRPDASVEVS
jgi:hypothetical protein